MTWRVEDNGSFHITEVTAATWSELGPGLSPWLARVAELALSHLSDDWDCVVCDLWPDDGGRLIANVQPMDLDVGMDVGFRVCANLTLEELAGPELRHPDVLQQTKAYLWEQVAVAAGLEPARSPLAQLQKARPFTIYGTSHGEGPLYEWGDKIV